MANPKTPFLGVPSGDVYVEAPDANLCVRGQTIETPFYDGRYPLPGTPIRGDFDNVRELFDKD